MVLVKLHKVGRIASDSPVVSFRSQHTVVLVCDCQWVVWWYGWYGVQNFPAFGCFTNTVSLTCMSESLIGLLLSARVFFLSFCCASCSCVSAGFKFVSHGTATGQGSLIPVGLPKRAVAGATPVVQ